MPIDLGRRLIASGVVPEEEVEAALFLAVVRGQPFARVLVDRGALTERQLEDELEKVGGLSLRQVVAAPELIARLPAAMCRRLAALPTRLDPVTGVVDVAAADPMDPHVAAEFGFHFGAPVRVLRAPLGAIEQAIRQLELGADGTERSRPRRATPPFPHGAPQSTIPPPPTEDIAIPLIVRRGGDVEPDTREMSTRRRPREGEETAPVLLRNAKLDPSSSRGSMPNSEGVFSGRSRPQTPAYDGGFVGGRATGTWAPDREGGFVRGARSQLAPNDVEAPSVSFPSEPPVELTRPSTNDRWEEAIVPRRTIDGDPRPAASNGVPTEAAPTSRHERSRPPVGATREDADATRGDLQEALAAAAAEAHDDAPASEVTRPAMRAAPTERAAEPLSSAPEQIEIAPPRLPRDLVDLRAAETSREASSFGDSVTPARRTARPPLLADMHHKENAPTLSSAVIAEALAAPPLPVIAPAPTASRGAPTLREGKRGTLPPPYGSPEADDVPRLLRAVRDAPSRDELVRLSLRCLRRVARRVAVFAVRKDGYQGWACNVEFGDQDALKQIHVPGDVPSVLATAAAASFYFGPIPSTPGHAALLRLMETASPDVAAVAVRVAGRAAMILVADDLDDTMLGTRFMTELAHSAESALSRLLGK